MATSKFKYVGDPNDRFGGPEVVTQYGITWKKGDVVTLPDNMKEDDLRRLEGNSHFVDMSDKDEVAAIGERQKALDKAEADKAKAEDEQRKRDEADEKARQRNLEKQSGSTRVTAENAPRPPGNVTREPVNEAFGGRTVEQRTQAEDHTKAGKTKG